MKDDFPELAYAEWHLQNWAKWMRAASMRLGYPSKSAGLQCGGISGEDAFDHMCEEADSYAAKASDSSIESLAPREQGVIHHFYLHAVYRFRGQRPTREMLEEATKLFWREAQKRGLT